MDTEIEKGYDPYEPTVEDIRCIELSGEEFKQGKLGELNTMYKTQKVSQLRHLLSLLFF
ncbi:hypothetical protein [Capnocytophaga sp.]|uniref:hypothetical protein n=1 Tax=Capnocytophaga sp. TaxID=44737 RepID=UPI0026DB23B8|nr:hypothetical protein [Capnocytophaga sp.]MDO5105764.1 hypothetical protein [Capnocytophaga sp.]